MPAGAEQGLGDRESDQRSGVQLGIPLFGSDPALAWLAEISEEEFRETFRGSPIKRAKHNGLRRNALIAIGNSGDRNLVPAAERASHDPDPTISETALWAKERLERTKPPQEPFS